MNNTVLSLSEHSHSQILNQLIPNTADSALGVSQASVVLGNDYIMPNRGSIELENEYLIPANGETRMSQHSSSLADDLQQAEDTLNSMLQNKRSKTGSQLSRKEKSSSMISYQEDQIQDAIKSFRNLTDHSNPELEIDLQKSLSELLSNDVSPANRKSA